jgi:non-lysosomal glucosylceramidase
MNNPFQETRPVRRCNCAGGCGPPAPSVPVSRRQFLETVGIGAAAAFFAHPSRASFALPDEELQRWRRNLQAPAPPTRYLSHKHTDARLHLGGIGTGNFEIGADGQLTTWQLFNTLRDGHVPFYFLAKAGDATRLLQTQGGPGWPRVKQIEMTGEYPVARLRFLDEDLPVKLELTAFTPFAPLDPDLSSIPAAVFNFRIENPGKETQEIALAGLIQNPIGYEAKGDNNSLVNPCFGGNVNHVFREHGLTGLLLAAEPAGKATLDQSLTIVTRGNLKDLSLPPVDRPGNLALEIADDSNFAVEKLSDPARTVIWLEEAPTELSMAFLTSIRDAVRIGATLVFSGTLQPLLRAYASWTGGQSPTQMNLRPDILFEDFESGYRKWDVEGSAFGNEPAHGTLPNQQQVSGFLGQGLVNSYRGGDGPVGRLLSKAFPIERRFIRFLIGGGHHQETQLRLVVDGQTVRAASGKDNERLEPGIWDVSNLDGKQARLEIVDAQTGGWGHINVDQIEFSDLPGPRELLTLLEEMLPARFTAVRPVEKAFPAQSLCEFENLVIQPGTTYTAAPDGRHLWSRTLGKGKVVMCAGTILAVSEASISSARQRAYAFVCALAGAQYRGFEGPHPEAPGFGGMALVTSAPRASVLSATDDWDPAWARFSQSGSFNDAEIKSTSPSPAGHTLFGGVAATVKVPAGGSVEVPFLLVWRFPNKYNSQNQAIGCHYAKRWPDLPSLLREAAAQLPVWQQRTEQFRNTFYNSSLPYWLLDCLTANAAICRHVGVVFQIGNGDVYGWEGSNGCCDPTCTHVWGYEQSFARLFPGLERDMRRIDFKHQQGPEGGINNRTDVPSPPRPTGEQPFADGHASCVLKAYREALNHPDEGFFHEYWPHVKRAVEYLIKRDVSATGGEPAGVLQDDQWNTYDEALHGVTSFISGYYLAALRAGEEWARRVGDTSAASRFRGIFETGRNKVVELCWNGEYFQQHLADYLQRQGEVGPGCMSDQLIGQWWAHQLGLGYLLPKEKVISALQAIFKYNFKSDLTGWKHAPRAFAGAHDKGLIICTWPNGGRPASVMLYSDEVWTGIEYQVASHLIYEGLVEEGLAVAKGARERYDGIPRPPMARNPWNEIECGGHYARAMSSWSLLLALSGWHYDAPQGVLRFIPRLDREKFKSFFSGPQGWGTASQLREGQTQINEFAVSAGEFSANQFFLETRGFARSTRVEINGRAQHFSMLPTEGALRISLKKTALVKAGQTLRIRTEVRSR